MAARAVTSQEEKMTLFEPCSHACSWSGNRMDMLIVPLTHRLAGLTKLETKT